MASQKCCVPTKRGNPCTLGADRQRDGRWYCHVHDPLGTFARQHPRGAAKRAARLADQDPPFAPDTQKPRPKTMCCPMCGARFGVID